MKTRSISLAGTWVHPPDGDNYPVELRMKVSASVALGITTWQTETDHGGEFGVSRWQYIYPEGSEHIMFSVQARDGEWSPLRTLAGRYVSGNTRSAVEVLRAFFADGGYVKEEK